MKKTDGHYRAFITELTQISAVRGENTKFSETNYYNVVCSLSKQASESVKSERLIFRSPNYVELKLKVPC